MTFDESLLGALASTEKAVLSSAKAVLGRLADQSYPGAVGLTGSLVVKCYCQSDSTANRLTEHYVKVLHEVYQGMLQRQAYPLSVHAEKDLTQVMAEAHPQITNVLNGQDPYTACMMSMEQMAQHPHTVQLPPGVCLLVPMVGHLFDSNETVVSLRIAFRRRNDNFEFEPYGISRNIVAGRHYGKSSAFVRPDRSGQM